jgi:hypothetical protein
MTGSAHLIMAHIAGVPLEEAVLSLAPVLALGGWGYLRAMADRRLHKDRTWD